MVSLRNARALETGQADRRNEPSAIPERQSSARAAAVGSLVHPPALRPAKVLASCGLAVEPGLRQTFACSLYRSRQRLGHAPPTERPS